MFENVLIISDNLLISKRFYDILKDLNLADVKFNIAISPFSNRLEFEKIFGTDIKILDLKDASIIEEIIDTYDLVLSLHCKQIFPLQMVNNLKCINIHPGYNPINRGWYPQVFSIINNTPIGATIHEIDNELDHGPIIARKYVLKSSVDTSETLYNKIVDAEIDLIKENIISILNNGYSTFSPESEGELHLKKDFKRLCELDLNEKSTLLETINKLRALTHGDFKNAYFIDPETQKKVFVSINLEHK